MKSNVTVGPPVDLMAYPTDELDVTRSRRFAADDPDLIKIRVRWEQALRQAVLRLPEVRFKKRSGTAQQPPEESIQLVEHQPGDLPPDQQSQQQQQQFPTRA
jgi:predicted proteasome-type protease